MTSSLNFFFNSFLYKTNRFQVAVRLFNNRSQRTSKCGKNISDTLGCASCATFLFLPHFDVICDLLLKRRTGNWNLFVNYIISSVMHAFWLVFTYDLLEDRRIDDVIIKLFFLILYYIKQIDSKWLFCSYHILTSSMTYHWTDARQLGIYLLNRPTATTSNLFVLYSKEAKNLSR